MSIERETAATREAEPLSPSVLRRVGDGLLGDIEVGQLVRARLAAREDHRGLGEVEIGEGRLGPLVRR